VFLAVAANYDVVLVVIQCVNHGLDNHALQLNGTAILVQIVTKASLIMTYLVYWYYAPPHEPGQWSGKARLKEQRRHAGIMGMVACLIV
jgi:hypothetical protein